MAKIRVQELAKELNRPSREVIEFLRKKGVEVSTTQNSLEDDVAGMVRKELGNHKPAGTQGTEGASQAGPETEAPKKKKKIIIVSNQQNSKMGGGRAASSAGGTRTQGRGNYSTQSGYTGTSYVSQGSSRSERDGGKGGAQGVQRNRTAASTKQEKPVKPVKPIKPLTPPSPTPSVQMMPSKPAPKPRSAEKPSAKPQEAKGQEAAESKSEEALLAREEAKEVLHSAAEQTSAPETVGGTAVEKEGGKTALERGAETSEKRPMEKTESRPSESRERTAKERPQSGERSREGRTQDGRERDGRGREGRSQDGRERDGRSREGRTQDGRERDGRSREGRTQDGRERDSRGRGQYGDRMPYGDRSQSGDRPSYGDRSQSGDRTQGGRTGQGRGGAGNGRPGYNRTDGSGRPGRPGFEGGQTDRFGRSGGQGNGRGGSSFGQGGRGNAGPGSRTRGKDSVGGFASEAPSKDVEKKREQDKRRISQEKDKRSRREMVYEEEEKLKKPGRFIKPEKKEEEAEEVIKVITLPDNITIKDLADKMRMQPAAIIKKLFLQGKVVTVNQEISYEDAENIAMEYEILCEREVKVDVIEELLREDEEDEASMVERPPVVCVMGHVDHGKTSLLDAIRKTNVTDKEAGGITQHIGAYMVNINGRKITFLDTPGHEAFTAMRMRGANATDIAILVVAADDGVMPQTIEAINHAKAAGVEIIVAVNKIDKPSANVERVKQELTEYGLVAESWGGSTVFAPVSAKTGEGIEEMLEMILLSADLLELKANPDRRARGLVIEAELDKGRGPVATVLVQKGTLHVGDFISAGASSGKVRAMIDDKGKRVKEATPSMPVEILGLNDVPSAGEVFLAHDSDKTAKTYAETYLTQNREKMIEETKSRMSLDDLFSQIKEGNLKELNLIVKADVQGSVEAVKQSLSKLSNEEVVVKCIHGGVGAINESDVMLAGASNAIIIGFNVRPDATAKATAERENVDIRLYKVIYQAIEDIEAAMKGMLDPIFEEKVIGHAEVRQLFRASAIGNIAGSYVLDGVFQRNCKIRITREGKQIYEGELASLKRFKDDVKEVRAGYECGLVFAGFDQMQELDIVEAYVMVEVPR